MPKDVIDPVQKMDQFKADLAAMKVGPKAEAAAGGPKFGRMQTKQFGRSDYRYNRWSGDLDEQQTLQDALDPRFWVDQAEKLMGHDQLNPKGVGDIIEVRKRDTGLYAELIVTEIGSGFIRVQPLKTYEPPVVKVAEDAPYLIKWNVSKRAHEVLRAVDKHWMAGPFQTKQAAAGWIEEQIAKTVKAA